MSQKEASCLNSSGLGPHIVLSGVVSFQSDINRVRAHLIPGYVSYKNIPRPES